MEKQCTGCQEHKLLTEFGYESRTSDGLRQKCKACRKIYRLLHSIKDKRKNRKKDPVKARISAKNYYWRNVTAKRQAASLYRKVHKAKVNATNAKRQSDKLQRTPKWLTSLHFQQIELFYAAAVSLTKEFNVSMHVDHIVPLKGKNVSGLHVPWNLQVIPASENISKGNRLCA